MSDHTPSTEDMEEQFVAGAMVTGFAYTRNEARTDFDQWLAEVKAEAWEEGAQAAWLRTGDGWNGEYAEGTHDGSRSFRDCNPDTPNPYRTQDGK